MSVVLHVSPDSSLQKEENYYKAIGEITIYRHREKLINELLDYLASVISNLEKSETKIRSILNTAADGILTYDENGIIDSVNPAAGKIFGASDRDLSGLHVNVLIGRKTDEPLFRSPAAVSVGGGYEDTGIRDDGTQFPVYIAVEKIKLGAHTMFTAIVRDITEQKKAEGLIAKATAKEETDKILSAIEQGLFLLYQKDGRFQIGAEFSKVTESILGEPPGEKDFLSMLGVHIPEDMLRSAQNYLSLMFKEDVFSGSLLHLNPLDEVPFQVQLEGDIGQSKILHFMFSRVIEGGKIAHLMAVVTDITEEKQLKEKLRENERRAQTQMELLFKILHVDPSMLGEFIEETRIELDLIDAILKRETEAHELRERLNTIFRSVHKIKGDADLLGLGFFAEKIHAIEDRIAEAVQRENVSAQDFLPLLFAFGEIVSILEDIQQLVKRLMDFRIRFGETKAKESGSGYFIRSLQALVHKLSDELGKAAEIDFTRFDTASLPRTYRKVARDLLVQLIKNSMIHGIEKPQERVRLGKKEKALITIRCEKIKNRVELEMRDDGRGLQINDIKSGALRAGSVREEEIASWPPAKIAKLIFADGVSTAKTMGLHAGRGIGMSMIRETVHGLGGKLTVRSVPGSSFRLIISLPEA